MKGRPETARIFCNALARHPLQQRSAREMLERLSADPALNGDPRVSRDPQKSGRKRFRRVEYERRRVPVGVAGKELAQPNGVRAADGALPGGWAARTGLRHGSHKLKDFSYPAIPRLYQEAAIIHARSTGKRPVIPGYELDAAVLASADQFAQSGRRGAEQEGAMQAALAAGFGDSYFFYWAFGISGR